MAKVEQYYKNSNNKTRISVCDIFRDNSSAIIKKIESQTPIHVQLLTDVYTEYLHFLDDLYSTCYTSEKHFFDRLGFDQKSLKKMEKTWNAITQSMIANLETHTNIRRAQVGTMISLIKSYDQWVHFTMDSWAKMVSQVNAKPSPSII